ncbi:SDR family oxidoreductase [Mariniluteicoccus endophyticus]
MPRTDERLTTLITGASSGLGAEMARQLAAKGCDLALCARRVDRLDALAADLEKTYGVKVTTHALDVADHEAVSRVFRDADTAHGGIARFIANAGVGGGATIGKGKAEANRMAVQTNLIGTLNQCESALELLRPRGRGHLVLVSSMSALRGMRKYFNIYAATKAAVARMGEGLAAELDGTGIDVSVLYPGYIRSEMNEGADVPFMVDTQTGVRAMVAAMEARKTKAFVPAWPWVPMGFVLSHAPMRVVKKIV